jgi:hypothetical protein
MKHSLLCAAMVLFATPAFAADAELKTATLPLKQYNVTIGSDGQQTGRQMIGTIPFQENMSIHVGAEEIKTGENGVATLRGKARVQVMLAGKAVATFSAGEYSYLVLTPWVDGRAPIGWRETYKFLEAYDEAFKTRDASKLTDSFAPDVLVSLEEATATGTTAKNLSRAEFVKFIQNLAPGALKVVTRAADNNHGGVTISEDERSASGTRYIAYDFTLPHGTLTFAPVQTFTVSRGENGLRITSLSVKMREPEQGFAPGGRRGR